MKTTVTINGIQYKPIPATVPKKSSYPFINKLYAIARSHPLLRTLAYKTEDKGLMGGIFSQHDYGVMLCQYRLIQNKQSTLSRSQRDIIEAWFNRSFTIAN